MTYTAAGKIDQNTLIKEYLPIVRRQALAMQVKLPANIDLDDLIQAGLVGVLDALTRFDPDAGTSFAGFAAQRIRGAMIDELRVGDWMPRNVRNQGRKVDTALRRLEQRLGRAPVEREVADDLGMPLDEYRNLLADINSGYLLPLEELITEGGEPRSDGAEGQAPYAALLDGRLREELMEAVEQLPEREKLLMALHYQEHLNLKEIGKVLGVTVSRVSQLHSQAIARLRSKLPART